LIIYRQEAPLKVRRAGAPEPPFYCATAIRPYSFPRDEGAAIDFVDGTATSSSRLEVTVCANVVDQLERERFLAEPVLIDATSAAEELFGGGKQGASFCRSSDLETIFLTTVDGALPDPGVTTAVVAWPLNDEMMARMFEAASSLDWGVVIPIVHPLTTDLQRLRTIVELALTYKPAFLCAEAIELDPTSRRAIASAGELLDEETFASLFDEGSHHVVVASERHVAAVAHEAGLLDHVPFRRAVSQRSNWAAATLLARTAARMFAMEHDVEKAWTLQRAARLIAALGKPLRRVAEAASLSIIAALDAESVEILEAWVEGNEEPPFVQSVNERWRLRRDLYR
jgi:hypothetical protein